MPTAAPAHRRNVLLGLLISAVVLVPAAIALACNPQAHIKLDRRTYESGATITVSGSYFPSGATINVSGPSGSVPVVASSGGGFSTSALTAPSQPGTYTITASRPTGGFAPASFTVAAPAAPAPAPAQQPAGAAPAAEPEPAFRTPAVARSQAEPQRSTPQRGTPQRSRTAPREAPARSTPAPAPAAPAVTTTVQGQQVFAGSAPAAATQPSAAAPQPARSRQGATRGERRSTASRATATPSAQAALGDLWSGYQPGRTPSLMTGAGQPQASAGPGLAMGIALMGFGLLALIAGLTAAEVRRRRPV